MWWSRPLKVNGLLYALMRFSLSEVAQRTDVYVLSFGLCLWIAWSAGSHQLLIVSSITFLLMFFFYGQSVCCCFINNTTLSYTVRISRRGIKMLTWPPVKTKKCPNFGCSWHRLDLSCSLNLWLFCYCILLCLYFICRLHYTAECWHAVLKVSLFTVMQSLAGGITDHCSPNSGSGHIFGSLRAGCTMKD